MKRNFKFFPLAMLFVSCHKGNTSPAPETGNVSATVQSIEIISEAKTQGKSDDSGDRPCGLGDNKPSFSTQILPIFQKYCTSCHNTKSPAGGIELENYVDHVDLSSDLERWNKVGSQISNGTMPPKGLPTLNECERGLWDKWLQAFSQNQRPSEEEVHEGSSPKVPFASAPLQRLSKLELENTLYDLFGTEVAELLKPKFQNIPDDDRSGWFENFNWSLSPGHINAYFDISTAAAELIINDPKRLHLLGPCLTAQVIEAECVKTFIKSFGLKAFRRPLKSDEMNSFFSIYSRYSNTAPEGIASIIRIFLQSPQFLYKFEIDGEPQPEDPNSFKLSQFEFASRLSFMLIRSSPDLELLELAERGGLADESEIRRQIERLLLSGRSKKMANSFFTQWLRLNSLPELSYSDEFRGDIKTESLRNEAIAETLWFIDHLVWEKKATYRDLHLSRLALIPSMPLAQTYNVQPSDSPIELPLNTRRGILTRVSQLLSGHDEVSPIHRGSFIRSQLLCDVLLSPDPKQLPPGSLSPPIFDSSLSTRERWERKTDSMVCQSCHTKMNPLGFSLGNYDGLGRFVDHERALDANGQLIKMFPINSTAVPELSPGDGENVTGPLDLSELFANSQKASECFVKQWFRFSFQRLETESDRKTIDSLMGEMQNSGEGIKGMIQKTLLLPESRIRSIR